MSEAKNDPRPESAAAEPQSEKAAGSPPQAPRPRKRRWLRIAVWLVGVIVALVVAARVAAPFVLPGVIAGQASAALGTEVTVGGIDMALLRGSAALENLAVAAPEGFQERELLRVGRVGGNVALVDLPGKVTVQYAELRDVLVVVETNEQGQINVASFPGLQAKEESPPKEESGPYEGPAIELRKYEGRNLAFRYVDRSGGAEPKTLRIENMNVDVENFHYPQQKGELRAAGSMDLGGEEGLGRVEFNASGMPLDEPRALGLQVDIMAARAEAVRDFLRDLPITVKEGEVSGDLQATLRGDQIDAVLTFKFKEIDAKLRSGEEGLITTFKNAPLQLVVGFLESAFAETPIKVHVSGSLNDPSFHPWETLRGLIAKAIIDRAKSLDEAGLLIVKNITEAGEVVVNKITDESLKAGREVLQGMNTAANKAAEAVEETVEKIASGTVEAIGDIGGKVGETQVGEKVTESVKGVGEAMEGAAKDLGEKTGEAAKKIESKLRDGILGGLGRKEEPAPEGEQAEQTE